MFFEILFFIIIFIFVFGEFLYPKIIFLLPPNPVKKSETTMPNITILIPAYNEERAIADKIKNTLALNYPENKREIVVIDNGSSDKTYEIASRFPVTLLKSERGKLQALNRGINYAKTEAIAITDADVELSEDSIKSAVSYLSEKIGAVGGYIVAEAEEKNSLMREKEKYKKKDWELRYQESMIDSVCNLDGKFLIFRKSIFPGFPENALVDDYFMTFNIRVRGYRLIIDKSAKVHEKLEGNWEKEIEQFKRYAMSALIINFKNIKFLFNPKYGYFGLLTFPFRRFFPVLYPVFMLYIIIFLLFASLSTISKLDAFAAMLVLGVIALIILLAAIFLFLRKKLQLVQLSAVFMSYLSLLKVNNLKFGQWTTLREK